LNKVTNWNKYITVGPVYSDTGYSGKPGYSGNFREICGKPGYSGFFFRKEIFFEDFSVKKWEKLGIW